MNELFYLQPANTFGDALLCGNGRLGCIVYGKITDERLVLNEETLWSGKKRDRINQDARKNLPAVRKLIFDGKIAEAELLANRVLAATPVTQRRYKSMCDLNIKFLHGDNAENFRRELDLESAVITTTYTCGKARFKREVFASKPADCIVVRLTAESGSLDFVLSGKAKGGFEKVKGIKGGTVFFGGEKIKYVCGVRVAACDGTVISNASGITVRNATSAVLLITAATDYKCAFPLNAVKAKLSAKTSYENLLREHVSDYRRLYDRVYLNLGDNSKENMPTDQRLAAFARGENDENLISLFFNYGRYLLISCSREGGLPANLQGVWNEDYLPCWDSKYTININLQMNYWLADVCGLDECYKPFFALLKRVRKSGKRTARKMYGCRGFVAHHNTDINADTAPQDAVPSATYWALGGAWLCLHIFDHYLFTQDKEFLRKNYPVLRDAVLFFSDFLIPDGKGRLVTCPSISPENSYFDADKNRVSLCAAPTSDIALLRGLFSDFMSAAAVLKRDKKLAAKAEEMLKKLPPYKVGSDGRLMEWQAEYEECDKGHRHLSHLIGLYPCNDITVEKTPELASAAGRSLAVRLQNGGGGTGWSSSWIINLFARLKDGEGAYKSLRNLFENSVFNNLADNHPRPSGAVFQIDGNFGAASGIAEMLLQSYDNKIFILPALPEELQSGEFKGFRTRGGAVCDVKWQGGKATYIRVKAVSDCEVTYNGKSVRLSGGECAVFDGQLNREV